jgi:hypothetical protein
MDHILEIICGIRYWEGNKSKVRSYSHLFYCSIFLKYVFGDVVVGEDGQQCYKI